jgi:hypothetical protein
MEVQQARNDSATARSPDAQVADEPVSMFRNGLNVLRRSAGAEYLRHDMRCATVSSATNAPPHTRSSNSLLRHKPTVGAPKGVEGSGTPSVGAVPARYRAASVRPLRQGCTRRTRKQPAARLGALKQRLDQDILRLGTWGICSLILHVITLKTVSDLSAFRQELRFPSP